MVSYRRTVLTTLKSRKDVQDILEEDYFQSSDWVVRFCECRWNHYDNSHHDHTGILSVKSGNCDVSSVGDKEANEETPGSCIWW